MKIRIRTVAVLLAVAGIVGASADSCGKGVSSSGGANSAPSMQCLPNIDPGCTDNGGGVQVSANPQPTNPGVGHVSGACRFSIKGPAADKTGNTGLQTKQTGSLTWLVAGIVWGYCTDTLSHFSMDVYIYYTPDQATIKPKVVGWQVYARQPGPAPTPFAVTAPCVGGVYRLEWVITATDEAGNMLPGGPYGGLTKNVSMADCGIVPQQH